MFAVDDLDDTLDRLGQHGARLVGDVVQYQDAYRLCRAARLLTGARSELRFAAHGARRPRLHRSTRHLPRNQDLIRGPFHGWRGCSSCPLDDRR
jgi:hypothetical protein